MNKKYTAAALELAIVLLITQIAFVWGKCAALLKRIGKGAESVAKRDPCKGCRYYCGGGSSHRWTCDYILIEHHRRPCPPGKGCTVKTVRKREGAIKHGKTI